MRSGGAGVGLGRPEIPAQPQAQDPGQTQPTGQTESSPGNELARNKSGWGRGDIFRHRSPLQDPLPNLGFRLSHLMTLAFTMLRFLLLQLDMNWNIHFC